MALSSVSQHARELETRRREAEERERRKQREVQMELERQLKEAEMVKKKFSTWQQLCTESFLLDFDLWELQQNVDCHYKIHN